MTDDDILDALADGLVDDVVRAAIDGGSLDHLLRALDDAPEFHDDLVAALVAAVGAAQAREHLRAAAWFIDVDLDTVLDRVRCNATIQQALDEERGLADVLVLLELDACRTPRAAWLRVVARRFQLEEIARHAVQQPFGTALVLLRVALHVDSADVDDDATITAFDALLGVLDVATAAILMGPLGWCDVVEPAPSLTVAHAHAVLLGRLGRSPSTALRWVDTTTPRSAWLPLFHSLGVPASALVLAVRDRAPDLPVIDVVRELVAVGYRDDLLEGLRMNGLGVSSSLQHLARCGWHVDRMVEDLLRNNMLLPDVRDELKRLGLPATTIADALLRHAPADVVGLVMR